MRPVYNFNKILPNIYRQPNQPKIALKPIRAKINFNELFQQSPSQQSSHEQTTLQKQPQPQHYEEPIEKEEEEKREIEYFNNDIPHDWFI
jgi:hypothetical protein